MLGGCAHRHVQDWLNPDVTPPAPSSYQEGIFARGERAEAWVKEQLQQKGWSIRGIETDFTKQINVSMFAPVNLVGFGERDRICISASLDGVITKGDTVRRLEVKALGQKGFTDCTEANTICAIDQYAYQTSAAAWGCDWKAGEKGEMRNTPHPIQVVIVRQGEYQNADGTVNRDGVFFEVLEAPWYTPDQLFQRCRDILVMCRDGIVPECDARYPCSWTAWEKEQAMVKLSPEAHQVEFELIERYESELSDLAFLTQQVESTKEEVKKAFGAHVTDGVGAVELEGHYRVTLTKNGRVNVKSLL